MSIANELYTTITVLSKVLYALWAVHFDNIIEKCCFHLRGILQLLVGSTNVLYEEEYGVTQPLLEFVQTRIHWKIVWYHRMFKRLPLEYLLPFPSTRIVVNRSSSLRRIWTRKMKKWKMKVWRVKKCDLNVAQIVFIVLLLIQIICLDDAPFWNWIKRLRSKVYGET